MATVKLILRTHQADKAGAAPLYIRVIKDRKTKFISTGYKFLPAQWNPVDQVVRKSFKGSARMNALLAQKVADASGEVADMERKSKTVSARRLKEAINGKRSMNFFAFADDRLEKMKNSVSIQTLKAYKAQLKKFEEYNGSRDVNFDDMTVTFLKDYINYCSNKLGNTNTTVKYSLLILAIFFKEAIREDLVYSHLYPFDKIKIKKDPGKRMFLSKTQLQNFTDLKANPDGKAQVIKDMFLFSVYAGGLRLSDVIEIAWEHIDLENQRISKKIRKTGRVHSFKFGQSALEILNKYKPAEINPSHFVFPMLDNGSPYHTNELYAYEELKRCSSLCGFHLRAIGKQMKLPFSLSFHLARHTFATNALNNGMRIEHVSKLLDHTSIGTTQIYAKIISQELDDAVDKYIY